MKHIPTFESFLNEAFLKYSLQKVGGFAIGDYNSISAAKKAMRGEEPGFYQIIDNQTGIAVWEGNKK